MTTRLDPGAAPDLSDAALYQTGNPEPIWQRLRAERPVYRNERAHGAPFWAVMNHDLVAHVLRRPDLFVSEKGMRLDANPAATAAAAGKMLIVTDPPRHGKIRRLVGSAFTPRMVRRLEENMRATATRALEDAFEQEVCDFVQIAARLPVAVICDMLGVPREDWDFMRDRTMKAFGSAATAPAERMAMVEAHADILAYYDDLVRRRRKQPGDDVVSALAHGEIDGVPLTDEEIYLNCDGLISGANETTRHATAGGLLALMDHPAAWQALRQAPELLPAAVQEILRYTSPAMHVLRTVAKDVPLGEEQLRAGDLVALWLPSANRDEAVFPGAAAFDIRRSPNRHLAFGHGNHHCLGASLAATELAVMFGEIVRLVGDARPAAPVRRLRSNLIWGIEAMPVLLTRRA